MVHEYKLSKSEGRGLVALVLSVVSLRATIPGGEAEAMKPPLFLATWWIT